MKTLIVSATRDKSKYKTHLFKSIKTLEQDDVDLEIHTSNKSSLPIIYNKYMCQEYYSKYECILFVHDDVCIDDTRFISKIKKLFGEGFGVVGLAGADNVRIKRPALWHIMSEQSGWSGAVAHPFSNNKNQIYVTSFGPAPKRCLIMDGLFLAIDTKVFKDTEVKFDSQFDFHHYDVDFCLQCNDNKIKLTTSTINVVHSSPGLFSTEDPVFVRSQDRFITKYAKTGS